MKHSRSAREPLAVERRVGRRLSIVIPVSDRSGHDVIAAFEETLVSVLENRPEGSEIVVVLGCEYADPWNIRDEVEFVRAPQHSSAVACVNVGICSCSGDIIHVLAPGWRATPDWTDGPMSRFRDETVGAVAPLIVSEKDRGKIVSQGVAYRPSGRRVVVKPPRDGREETSSNEPRGPVLQAGFWRAELFGIDGPGFAAACGDTCADVDLAVAAQAAGYQTVVEPSSRVVEPAGRRASIGGFTAGLESERLFWRAAAGRPTWTPLVAHAIEIVRHAMARAPFGTLPALAGRAAAIVQVGSYLARFRRLRAIRREAIAGRSADDRNESEGAILRFDERHTKLHAPANLQNPPLRRSA